VIVVAGAVDTVYFITAIAQTMNVVRVGAELNVCINYQRLCIYVRGERTYN